MPFLKDAHVTQLFSLAMALYTPAMGSVPGLCLLCHTAMLAEPNWPYAVPCSAQSFLTQHRDYGGKVISLCCLHIWMELYLIKILIQRKITGYLPWLAFFIGAKPELPLAPALNAHFACVCPPISERRWHWGATVCDLLAFLCFLCHNKKTQAKWHRASLQCKPM